MHSTATGNFAGQSSSIVWERLVRAHSVSGGLPAVPLHPFAIRHCFTVALCAGIVLLPAFVCAQSSQTALADLPSAPMPAGDDLEQQTPQQQPAPQPPSSQQSPPSQPSLGDLGFGANQADPKMQALLNKRTEMLKIHQRLGLITLAPMAATLITGPMAKAKGKNGEPVQEPTQANLDFHIALGGLTSGMYWSTAYFAIFAPKVPGVKPRGPIRLHRALAWVHGTGMVATPVLGLMAYKQEDAGEKVHGIASAHGPVAIATVGAYAAAMLSVSWPIHW
jgi:hypothetical protein